jgi:YD repeat-containing protein
MGRVANQFQETILNYGGTPYNMAYQYNYIGDVTQLTDAHGTVFTSTYNSAGEVTKTTSSFSDTYHPGTLFNSATYNAFGELAQATYGDGLVRANTYDSRGRLTEIQDGPYATPTYRVFLSYYDNGNVYTYQDNVVGRWTYAYDVSNRLATAANVATGNPNAPSYAYRYDEY